MIEQSLACTTRKVADELGAEAGIRPFYSRALILLDRLEAIGLCASCETLPAQLLRGPRAVHPPRGYQGPLMELLWVTLIPALAAGGGGPRCGAGGNLSAPVATGQG